MAISYLPDTASAAETAASRREAQKSTLYSNITQDYHFSPLGFETFGSWGPAAKALITKMGHMIDKNSGDPRSTDFLRQRISIELQRGNAACILGTHTRVENLDETLFLLKNVSKK